MPRREDELKARLLATFRVEAAEHLAELDAHLLALSDRLPPDAALALVEATFREMHTLKGAARSVGLRDVERLCQAAEGELSALNRARALPSRAQLDALEATLAEVRRGVAQAAAASAPAATPADTAAPAATIRVATDELDGLLRRAEDLLAAKLAAGAAVARAERLVAEVKRGDPRAAERAARALAGALRRDERAVASAVDGLLEQARRVRMTPAASVLDVFPRMVRDLARSQGKDVEWVAEGGELALDRRVLERIKDPLIHLVRNAVGHGIEPPGERAGKPPRGRVGVTVRAVEGGRIELAVTDDGRGIDAERVRDAARRARVADADAHELVFRSGLSTSFVITDVAGHGLGLAIVKEQVERLGGRVELDSRPGAGTTVRLLVPASVTTFRGLLVSAGGQRFLLPLEAVDRVVGSTPGEGTPLASVLGLPAGEPRACVLVAAGGERAGLLVDEVLGEREGLVREFAAPLVHVRHVAAAGLLGGGELVLILRVRDLIAGARVRREVRRPAQALTGPPSVLVVDDAATTRAMERGLLEMAGYRVMVAGDGLEAWETLAHADFDLVVSDVDMPRLDGFELTTRIRADARLAELPVILVSALEARADKERGIAVGANAYVVKSSFEQSNLLAIIRRLGVRPEAA
jgi:two-component system, chemotaxis family, sensor kinase CheA